MEISEIIREKIRDLLAMLDASEVPAVYNYLGNYVYGDDEEEIDTSPMSIVRTLQEMKPFPQLV